jgi:pimeloyl-ACP methyl ester carboxylesterase
MPKATTSNPADFIMPLNMNGLHGRMLQIPARTEAKKSKEILFVYGHHSSLERWWGLMQHLSRYGTVTMPDLPGFGGMQSFYTIGKSATIDNLADYLASFIKLRFRRKRIVVVGMSFGFVIVTRMLQRFPELAGQVDLLVSLVGFAHHDDFSFSKPRYWLYRSFSGFFSIRPTAWFFRYVCLNEHILRLAYARTSNAKHKFEDVASQEEFNKLMDFEVGLWHSNDVRTYMRTTEQFLTFDNCRVRINLPVWHVTAQADHYFSQHRVEQHMRVIFSDFHQVQSSLTNHAPSVIADEAMAAPLVPPELARILNSL